MSSMAKWCAEALVFAALVACGGDRRADPGEDAELPTQAEARTPDAPPVRPEADATPAPTPADTAPAPEPEARVLASAPLPVFVVARLGATGMRHPDIARAVASSADAARIASADNHGIRIWDTRDGALVTELEAPRTVALAFGDRGESLISAGEDGAARFWDVASKQQTAMLDLFGEPLGERDKPSREASALAISTDASLLIAGHEGGRIAVWDLAKRERLNMFDSGHGYVSLVAISPDRSLFATADYADRGAIIAVFELATGARVATLTPAKGSIHSVAFTPDNEQVVFGTGRDGVHVWDVQANTLVRTLDADEHDTRALALSVGAEGITVYGASGTTHDIRSWTLASGVEGQRYRGHAGAITSFVLSSDGAALASAAADHTVRVWTLADAEPYFADMGHAGPVTDLAWSAEGGTIATVATDGKIRLWDARAYALTRTLDGPPGTHRHVSISSDGATVVASADHEVRVFDAKTGALAQTLAHTAKTFAVAVSRDGGTIASGGFDGLRIWAADGTQQHHLELRGKRVASLKLSADASTLASGWDDGRVRLIDVASGEVTRTVKTGIEPETLAYSADGSKLAARVGVEKFGIFDAATGKALAKVGLPHPLAFGVGGHLLLATGMHDGGEVEISIVDVAPGQVVRAFLGHEAGITDAAFSPDGNTFASASEDTTVLIWAAP